MNRRRTISWLAACVVLIALAASTIVCTTCGVIHLSVAIRSLTAAHSTAVS